jgi:hypothetical protein
MGDIKFEVIRKISEVNFRYKNLRNISKLDSNSPPSVFIGSKLKYPLVNVGILSPLEREKNAWVYDDAKYWANNDFQINDVLKLRDNLLNSRFQSQVQDTRKNSDTGNRFIQMAQEIAISSKPVDVEIELKHRLNLGRNTDKILTPHGMSASLKKAKITGNVKIHRQVDKVMNDEIKSVEGMEILYKNNFTEYTLSKILSVGVLGLRKNKRLVPTRWSITATDDSIGKFLLKKVKENKIIEDYELFFGDFLGNCYLIMLIPDVWSYELFELYFPGSSWNPSKEIKASTDFEDFYGRKEYASATAGGYYASRLPIIEYLNSIKRQATVIAIRLETPTYWAALGVWVVRESVRKAIAKGAIKFRDLNETLESTKKIGKIKYNFDCEQIMKKSKLLNQIKTQRKLGEWF